MMSFMKVGPPALLPILRSDTVGELLAQLLLHPERGFTLTELSTDLGVSLPTVVREVDRMLTAGLLVQERVGRARRVSANSASVLFRPLSEVISLTFGPRPVLEELLAGVDRVEGAMIYGSWAARYLGEAGAEPNDVDVLVIGSPDPDVLYDAAEAARHRLKREVTIRAVPSGVWHQLDPQDPFLRHVKSRPMVRLCLGGQS
jgi:DNA-binding transcriptional ArsR family regulator